MDFADLRILADLKRIYSNTIDPQIPHNKKLDPQNLIRILRIYNAEVSYVRRSQRVRAPASFTIDPFLEHVGQLLL